MGLGGTGYLGGDICAGDSGGSCILVDILVMVDGGGGWGCWRVVWWAVKWGCSGCWACGLKIKLKLCSRNARLLWGRSALLLYSRWGEGVGVLVAVVLVVVLLL